MIVEHRLREWVKDNLDLSPEFAADIMYAADLIERLRKGEPEFRYTQLEDYL